MTLVRNFRVLIIKLKVYYVDSLVSEIYGLKAVSVTNVCVFVLSFLRPSQPSGVMSSAVSLRNHTFTGQA